MKKEEVLDQEEDMVDENSSGTGTGTGTGMISSEESDGKAQELCDPPHDNKGQHTDVGTVKDQFEKCSEMESNPLPDEFEENDSKAHYPQGDETDIVCGQVQSQILSCTGSLSEGSRIGDMDSTSDSAQIEHSRSIHTDFREKDAATEHASDIPDQSLMPTVIDGVKDNEDHVVDTDVENFQTESVEESRVVVDTDVNRKDFHEDMMFDSDELDYQDELDCQCTEVQHEVVEGDSGLVDPPLEDPAPVILDEAAAKISASDTNDHPEEEAEDLQGEPAQPDDLHKQCEGSTEAAVDANTDDPVAPEETRIEEIEKGAARKDPIVDDDVEAGVVLDEADTEKKSEISADKSDRPSEGNSELEEETEELQGEFAQPDDLNKMCGESTQAGVDADDPVSRKETQIEEIEREEGHKDAIVDDDIEAGVILHNIDRPLERNCELEEETEELQGELAQPDDLNKMCGESTQAGVDANDPVSPKETQIEEIEREEAHKDSIIDDDDSEAGVILDNIDRPLERNRELEEETEELQGELDQPDDLNKLCEGSLEAAVVANTDDRVAPEETQIEEIEREEPHNDPIVDDDSEAGVILDNIDRPLEANRKLEEETDEATQIKKIEREEFHKDLIIDDDNESGVRHHGAENYPSEGNSGPDVEVVDSKSQEESANTQQESVSDPVPTPPAPSIDTQASKKDVSPGSERPGDTLKTPFTEDNPESKQKEIVEERGELNPPARPGGSKKKEERKSAGRSWSLFTCCKFDKDSDNE